MARIGRKAKAKPVTVPGMGGRQIVMVSVPDPYEPGKRLDVPQDANGSPLSYVWHRGGLQGPGETKDDSTARYLAGMFMRELFEIMGGAGARAIDYSAIKVDTSFTYAGLTERQAKAAKTMGALREHLGPYRFDLLHSVCCEEVFLIAWLKSKDRARGMPGRQDRLDAYQDLRDGLDAVIEFRGVAVGRRSRIRAEMV